MAFLLTCGALFFGTYAVLGQASTECPGDDCLADQSIMLQLPHQRGDGHDFARTDSDSHVVELGKPLQLTHAQWLSYRREHFAKLDKNTNGELDASEIAAGFFSGEKVQKAEQTAEKEHRGLNVSTSALKLSSKKVDDILDRADTDGSRTLNFEELLTAISDGNNASSAALGQLEGQRAKCVQNILVRKNVPNGCSDFREDREERCWWKDWDFKCDWFTNRVEFLVDCVKDVWEDTVTYFPTKTFLRKKINVRS